MKPLKIEVRGRKDSYHVQTLLSWLRELRSFLEEEVGRPVTVNFVEEESDAPLLYIEGVLVFEGLPGEEGYLIEIVKSWANRLGTRSL